MYKEYPLTKVIASLRIQINCFWRSEKGGIYLLNSLTSFRFIAALMVFLFHMRVFSQYQLGSAGVQFFFVLSGFILAYNYHSKFIEINKNNIKKFYKARFSRIYPVHVLTFLLSVPLVILYFHPNSLYFVKLTFMSMINLLLLQSFFPSQGTYFNFNGVSWTLSVETFFYFMFPFLLWIFIKLKVNKNIVKSVLIFWIVWGVLFLLNKNLDGDNPFYIWLLHIFPGVRLFEFSTGMLLGLIYIEKSNKENLNKAIFTVLELLSLLLFIVLLLYSANLDVGIVRGVYFVPLWCLLIFTFAFQGGMISKILSQRFFVYLGEISFSFYMIHQLVIRYLDFLHLANTYRFLICLVISLLFSSIIYQFYEEPLRKKIRFGFRKQTHKMQVPLSKEILK